MCTSPIFEIFLKHNASRGDRNKVEVMKRKNKEHSQIKDGWIDVLKLNKVGTQYETIMTAEHPCSTLKQAYSKRSVRYLFFFFF